MHCNPCTQQENDEQWWLIRHQKGRWQIISTKFKEECGKQTLAKSESKDSLFPPSGPWFVNTVVREPEKKLVKETQQLQVTDPSQRDRRPAPVLNVMYPASNGRTNVRVPNELAPRAGLDRQPSLVMTVTRKLCIAELELDVKEYGDNKSTRKRNHTNHQQWINFATTYPGNARKLFDELKSHADNENCETPCIH